MLPPLEVRFVAAPSSPSSHNALTPFHPTAGYQITREDFDPQARIAKLESLYTHRRVSCPIPGSAHRMACYVERDSAEAAGLFDGVDDKAGLPFRDDLLPSIQSLRLHVFLPSEDSMLSLASHPTRKWLELGEIAFTRFYPLDSGPLALSNHKSGPVVLREGLDIALPNDPVILATISGRFVSLITDAEDEGR